MYCLWRMCFEWLVQAFARWQPGILFDTCAQPILEYRWIVCYKQLSLQTQFEIATVYSIHTQSLSWCLTGLVPNNTSPESMKARISSWGRLRWQWFILHLFSVCKKRRIWERTTGPVGPRPVWLLERQGPRHTLPTLQGDHHARREAHE